MTLAQALREIAGQLGLPFNALMDYAMEDTRPSGSMPYVVECQLLYALVRALKPARVLEMGTHKGGSATHIAQAMIHNSREMGMLSVQPVWGDLTCVDINPLAGSEIPDDLRHLVEIIIADIDEYIRRPHVGPFDFIFEDGAHSEYQVHTIYERLDKLLAPGGVIVSHDAAVDGVKDFIAAGIRKGIGQDVPTYVIDPSPLGMTVYQR